MNAKHPRRTTPTPPKRERKRLCMSQLCYFVGILPIYLDTKKEEEFWNQIRQACPELAEAIDAGFGVNPLGGDWGTILFEWTQGPALRNENGEQIGYHINQQEGQP
jgi:hypothetical protein